MKLRQYIFIFLLFFPVAISSQNSENIKLSRSFYGCWLLKDIHDIVLKGSYFETYQIKGIKKIYLAQDSSKICFSTFFEGYCLEFKVLDSTTIEIPDIDGNKDRFVLYLDHEKNIIKYKNVFNDGVFVSLGSNYSFLEGDIAFFNDSFFTGEYLNVNDSTNNVIFYSNGSINGIEGYNKYKIPESGLLMPADFNTILLFPEEKKQSLYDAMKWERKGEYLFLYELERDNSNSVDPYSNAKISDKIYRIKKNKINLKSYF